MKYVTLSNILILGLLAIISVMGIRSCSDRPEHVTIIKPALIPTVQKTDKKGTTYTEIKGTLYTQAQMKHITDSLKRVLGKGKVTQVVVTVTKIDTQYKVRTENFYIDTTSGYINAMDSNKDVKLTFSGNWRSKQASFGMHLTPDTSTSVTTFKTPLIGRPTMTINQYHTNSLFQPDMGYTYSAKVPKTLLVIGPSAGGGWFTGSPGIGGFVGVTATIPVISIRSK